MPNLTADTSGNFDDAVIFKTGTNTADVRNASSAGRNNSGTFINVQHGLIFGSTKAIYRAALSFDFSGNDDDGSSISGNTVTSANLVIRSMANLSGFTTVEAKTDQLIRACKSTETNAIDGDTYIELDGYVSSGTYDGNVTVYGTANEAADATITFNLNSTCISDINTAIGSGGRVTIMLLCQDDFLSNIGTDGLGDPDTGGFLLKFEGIRMLSTENTVDASYKPKLELTYGAATAPNNATFFGTNF